MKSIYAIVLASLFVLGACRKEKQPTPPPPPPLPPVSAEMSRSFHYPATSTSEFVSYSFQRDSVIAKAGLNTNNQLILSFEVSFPKGHDYVKFTIDAAKVKPGYVGDYTIVHHPGSGITGDVTVIYRYDKDLYSYFELLPGDALGTLKITSYDATNKLLKGSYTVDMKSTHDPKQWIGLVETEIHVEGSFANVILK